MSAKIPVASVPEPQVPELKVLSRAAILESMDLASERVNVPEWGGVVIVRCLTGQERDAYESEIVGSRVGGDRELNLTNIRAKLVARTVVDESGSRLFTDGDIVALGKKNASVLDRIFSVAQRLSGLSQSDVDSLVDQMGKDQSDGSGSV
jgi:hypothetical protein